MKEAISRMVAWLRRVRRRGKFRESRLAHRCCKGYGLEIGDAAHSPFGLKTKNVDFTRAMTIFKEGR